MAMELTFTGWLNEVKTFDWGTVLKVSHSVRKKDDNGDWQTVSKDYVDVIIDTNKRDEFSSVIEAPVPCRVDVTGNCKPANYTNKDGEVVNYMKVWPNAIEVVEKDFVQTFAASAAAASQDVPF